MPGNIERRVTKLETKQGARSRIWVVQVPFGMEIQKALSEVDVEPAPSDTVVLVQRFAKPTPPKLVSVSGAAV